MEDLVKARKEPLCSLYTKILKNHSGQEDGTHYQTLYYTPLIPNSFTIYGIWQIIPEKAKRTKKENYVEKQPILDINCFENF